MFKKIVDVGYVIMISLPVLGKPHSHLSDPCVSYHNIKVSKWMALSSLPSHHLGQRVLQGPKDREVPITAQNKTVLGNAFVLFASELSGDMWNTRKNMPSHAPLTAWTHLHNEISVYEELHTIHLDEDMTCNWGLVNTAVPCLGAVVKNCRPSNLLLNMLFWDRLDI